MSTRTNFIDWVSRDESPGTLDYGARPYDVSIGTSQMAAAQARGSTPGNQPVNRIKDHPTLRRVGAMKGYGMSTLPHSPEPWVYEALRQFDPVALERISGQTKRGEGEIGMYRSLEKFKVHPLETLACIPVSDQPLMQRAIAAAHRAFALDEKPNRLSFDQTERVIIQSSVAGYPHFGKKKGEVLADLRAGAERMHNVFKQDAKADPPRANFRKFRFLPCLGGNRGGLSPVIPNHIKTRLVWVYPGEMSFFEARYAVPLYRAYMARPGQPIMFGALPQNIISHWASQVPIGRQFVGLDISAFDSSAPIFLIREAFDCMFENIIPWPTDHPLWQVGTDGEKSAKREWEARKHEVYKQVQQHYFINTPILFPDGNLYRKYTGVPSGSYWTQLIDSFVNYVYVVFMLLKQDVISAGPEVMVLGDDSIFAVPRDSFSIELAASHLLATLGVVVSPTKSEMSMHIAEIKILGFRHRGSRRVRTDDEWLEMALYPENWVGSLAASFTRLVGIWLVGGQMNTRYSEFYQFYQSGYPVPNAGEFSKAQKRWMTFVTGVPPLDCWRLGDHGIEYALSIKRAN